VIGFLALGCVQLASYSLNPAWLLDPDGFDYDKNRQKLTDTPRNRQRYLMEYKRLIEREASGAEAPWPAIWKGIYEALGENIDNPKLYQSYIIQERRARGLPELDLK
jgi:hypothetical protein